MKEITLLSFHGQKSVKEKFVKRLALHYKADEIIKGKYWEGGKGCDVGCTIHGSSHDDYQTETGICWQLALVFDSLFEKLPNGQAKEFPLQHTKAMPVGVDTHVIFKNFIIWNLADKKDGLIYHIKGKDEIKLLTEVAEVYKRSFKEEIPNEVWSDLAKRAYYAYAYASAYASAYAYAYASAYASAYAYAYASASYGTPQWQEKFDERILLMRDKLLKLIKSAKPYKK